jgi:hypothetical protein
MFGEVQRYIMVGVSKKDPLYTNWLGADSKGWSYYLYDGSKRFNGSR